VWTLGICGNGDGKYSKHPHTHTDTHTDTQHKTHTQTHTTNDTNNTPTHTPTHTHTHTNQQSNAGGLFNVVHKNIGSELICPNADIMNCPVQGKQQMIHFSFTTLWDALDYTHTHTQTHT